MNIEGIRSSFKAYDIRGKVPDELNADVCSRLGKALASEFPGTRRVVIGRDVRPSGLELQQALSDALRDYGIEVTDIGVCGTEEIYFATARHGFDLGIMLTASHNPSEYNGIKLVKSGAVPISGDSGLFALRDRVINSDFAPASGISRGELVQQSFRDEYIRFMLDSCGPSMRAKPFKIVMNPGNGCAGYVLEQLLPHLPGEFVIIQGEPDGSFPNGIPNPLLPERREDTAKAVREHKADLGLAWDGDFDRCFFYDADGNFVESYYLLGLLAQDALRRHPGGKIIHDTRLFWNTVELVNEAGGIPVQGKTGHAFMKERMRREDAVYGGEMSAHHYFRDFYYCDSGMLPWLSLLEIIASSGKGLAELVEARVRAYPCSGEINFKVTDAEAARQAVFERFAPVIRQKDYVDGLSADCGEWRFNLRSSNTEPLLRLNVESRGNKALMLEKTEEISEIIRKFS
ncbi:phosphomannomutase [Desulfovibrio sp. OttesenSCG-928-C06]|nr:phosphomannomutase [Desulfovibrio sp. OttesenSCG-928-C06]